MMQEINNLREISRRCLAGEPLDGDLAEWLGTSLHDFLHQRCRSVDDALGLRFAQGGVPWWREEAIRLRDGAIRDLAESFFSGLSTAAQAKEIYTCCLRYAASGWRFDQHRDEISSSGTGSMRELVWSAFKSGAVMPVGERQLRNILRK